MKIGPWKVGRRQAVVSLTKSENPGTLKVWESGSSWWWQVQVEDLLLRGSASSMQRAQQQARSGANVLEALLHSLSGRA